MLRGTVVFPRSVPEHDLRPRISIEATVWLMEVLLMLLKSGTTRLAERDAPITM